jgi:membrane protease subunit HflK
MAWNTPGGSSGKDGRNPWQRKGGGFDRFLDPLRGLFGDGGGGNIGRWIGILAALWLAFNCFVLVTEQQRGVVLRFGLFSRVLQPGPHFKWPWPIERVTKINATQIKTFSETVPVLTRDENIVRVEINVQYRVGDPQRYVFATRDADEVLKQAALSTVREQVGRSTLDTVLGARGNRERTPAELAGGLSHRPDRHRAQPAQRAPAGRSEARLRRRQQRAAGQGPSDQRSAGLRGEDPAGSAW